MVFPKTEFTGSIENDKNQFDDNHTLFGAKIRELIALAVTVTGQCGGCIVVHTEAALKMEHKEEILEALCIAVTGRAESALIYSTSAVDAARARKEGKG